jgi:thioredoxin-dependent peroxiredoxin
MRSLRRVSLGACALAALVLAGGWLPAAQNGAKVGDKAPAFESVDENGKAWKSSDHVGKKVIVLYFYPADFTRGCTAQACGFRDNLKAIQQKGVEVVGVSGDSAQTHSKFKKHHKLGFTLLADEKGELAKKFGIPYDKGGTIKFEGEPLTRGVTIQRWTVVIDREGNIAARYQVGNAAKDSEKILETVGKLKGK